MAARPAEVDLTAAPGRQRVDHDVHRAQRIQRQAEPPREVVSGAGGHQAQRGRGAGTELHRLVRGAVPADDDERVQADHPAGQHAAELSRVTRDQGLQPAHAVTQPGRHRPGDPGRHAAARAGMHDERRAGNAGLR